MKILIENLNKFLNKIQNFFKQIKKDRYCSTCGMPKLWPCECLWRQIKEKENNKKPNIIIQININNSFFLSKIRLDNIIHLCYNILSK